MPKVKIQKTLSVQAEKLFEAIQEVLTNDKELKALEPKLSVKPQKPSKKDGSLSAKLSGSRIEGVFVVSPDGDGSIIDVDLKLPLMMSPFKGLVQKKIEEKLETIA